MQISKYSSLLIAFGIGGVLGQISLNSTDTKYGFRGEMRGLSEKCAKAYSAEVQCSDLLLKFRNATIGPELFTEGNLKILCTTDCIDSLNSWDKKVQTDCDGTDKLQLEDPFGNTPVTFFMAMSFNHEIQENMYWPFCLKDQTDDSFCLVKEGLPEWPAKASGATKDSDFCKSSCRSQQAYLLYAASGGAKELVNCPNADVTHFPMNQISQKAFKTGIMDKKLVQTSGMLQGTSFNITTMFASETAVKALGTNSSSTSIDSPSPPASTPASTKTSGAANSTAHVDSGAVHNAGVLGALVISTVVGIFIAIL